ncbi:MAG: glycine oxidase ThiO [Acidobacteria bacterium]|nr:glycine oxidase ThiO [Acidobacteriota bacterium]
MRKVGANDILVIGAGVIGAAIARELSARGASVSILDARTPGSGATQASGGMLAPYTEAGEGGPLLELGARSLGLFDRFIGQLQQDAGIPVGYERTGTLHVAREDASLAHFAETAGELGQLGIEAQLLDTAAARAAEPNLAPDIFGGLLITTQGIVAAPSLTRALVMAAQRAGATLLEPARVQRIRAEGDGVRVDTTQGSIAAGTVVLAAGAWAGQVTVEGADAAPPVKPVRGQLLHLGWTAQQLARITWDERCYLVPWRDGTLLVGATVEDAGFDERNTVGGVRQLFEAVCDLLPLAWNATLLSARVGLRPGSPDPLPIIGWSSAVPRLMYATGHYRNGVLLAPLTAQVVADAVLDGTADPALALTSPARFGRL